MTALPLADSERVRVGDLAVAIGNPFRLAQTATAGIVSAVHRRIDAPNGFSIPDAIQTDAAINPGNSGGPLLNERGEVIGVNSQIETGGAGRGNVGIGFAVPANTVRAVVRDLADDVIVSIGAKAVADPDDVATAVFARQATDRVAVTVQRGGQRRTLQVTLGRQPRSAP